MTTQTIVTTSWDDGAPHDLKLAELLAEAGVKATFYVPIFGPEGREILQPADLRVIAAYGFEIGAHTMTHPVLSDLHGKRLWVEVAECKQVLEQTLGREVEMFCYPRGRYNLEVLEAVERAGYRGARTTRMLCQRASFSPFEMPTTLQAYPHDSLTYYKNLGKRRDLPGIYKYVFELRRLRGWLELGKKLFAESLAQGGMWHLYGHSWEIEELGLWDELRQMLTYVSNQTGVRYATNGQVLDFLEQPTAFAGNLASHENCPGS